MASTNWIVRLALVDGVVHQLAVLRTYSRSPLLRRGAINIEEPSFYAGGHALSGQQTGRSFAAR